MDDRRFTVFFVLGCAGLGLALASGTTSVAMLVCALTGWAVAWVERRERERAEYDNRRARLAFDQERLQGDQSIELCAHAYQALGWRLRTVDQARLHEARSRRALTREASTPPASSRKGQRQ